MRTILISLAGVVAAIALPGAARADTPFPSPKVQQAFVAAQTVTSAGAMITQVAPGGTVVFRAYAIDGKTHKTVTAKDATKEERVPVYDSVR